MTQRPFLLLVAIALTATGTALIWSLRPRPTVMAAPEPIRAASQFKITFGVKNRFPNVSWNGGIRDAAQVRSIEGWHLDRSDSIRPPSLWNLTLHPYGRDITPKAVTVDLTSPETEPVTFFTRSGDFTFTPARIPFGRPHDILNGNVTVERVPTAHRISGDKYENDDPAILRTRDGTLWTAWSGYQTIEQDGPFIKGGDQILISYSASGEFWSQPVAITPPGDHFRVALGEDASGRLWCVYALQQDGNFDLYARRYDNRAWSAAIRLTSNLQPDIFHRMASDAKGNLYLVWMGYRSRGTDAPQSDILMRVLNGNTWSPEIQVTDTPEDEWDPAVATGPDGKGWIAWDVYRATTGRTASYDLMLRSYAAGQLAPVQAVSETSLAEMRADLAVDAAGRVWIAWEEGGAHWGKDTGYENPRHRITLRKGGSLLYGPNNTPTGMYRRPRIAVLENGQLRQPEALLEQSYPEHLQANLFQNPRLGVDGNGRVWVFLRHQLIARGRWAGHMFDFYATTLSGEGDAQRWLAPILIPHSTGRQDTVLAAAPAGDALAIAIVGDGRRLPVGLPEHHDIYAAILDAATVPSTPPRLAAFKPSAESLAAPPHPQEAADVDRIRKHRITAGGARYKIVRGDLHRHTEISMDGAIDGTIWDLYRYAINAAAFDYIAVTEHNNGAWLDTDEPESRNTDDVYQWWRIQKSADLFHVRGRFVPLYGFERSVNFPLGHRNIIHAERGVFTLRVPKLHVSERPDVIDKDAQNLWSYLRATGGLAIPHTSGTSMGTDWRLRDDPLEPVTEIYQGDRNSYEEEGAPRAATKDAIGDGDAGRQPFQKGLIWNALGAGYKMGFIASSDHFSTHISYANLLVPDGATTREQVQDALRRRHTYASTDNIIVDFATQQALQGDEITASQTPAFRVNVIGTAPLLRVDVIKNNRVVYTRRGVGEFTFRDTAEFGGNFEDTTMASSSQVKQWTRPRTTGSYYYIRAVQSFSAAEPDKEGEIAWSSPIFVNQAK